MTIEELKTKTITELKAIAYDLILNQQNVANSLRVVLKEIDEKSNQQTKTENLIEVE